jgi:ribosomal 50S subunit-recycling heat shock protein
VRLDLFLKSTGIIPRRTVAKQACDQGLVEIDGSPAKASAEVRVGSTITTRIGMRVTRHEVLQIPLRAVPKADRDAYCRLISSDKVELEL